MRAVIIAGHGSLRRDSGAAMIRLAARAREAGIAPLVAAGFLNYSRPTLAQALARCAARGASEVVLVPYLLVPGHFARVALPRALAELRTAFPNVLLILADCLGDHPALAALVLKRAAETADRRPPSDDSAQAREALAPSSFIPHPSSLLLMAHGSPDAAANEPIARVADRVRATGRFAHVRVAFLDLNAPAIPDALVALVALGSERIVALPYFLQLGGHVAEDLPAIIAQAQQRHPGVAIALAPHLGYDALLAQVVAERAREAVR